MSSSVANNQHLQLTRQSILHIFPAQKLRLTSHFRKKKNRKNIFGPTFRLQNCLNRIISKLSDNTKKNDKNRGKKIIFGSELSKTNNEPTFRLHKKSRKSSKNIFGSELSKTNNEPTFRFLNFLNPKKMTIEKKYFWLRIV